MKLLIEGSGRRGLFILAHGAGMAMDHPFMNKVSELLASSGLIVVRFEFPYMQKRRDTEKKGFPDKLPILEVCFKEAVAQAIKQTAGESLPVYLSGKSLGGRVATIIAKDVGAKSVFVFGYPFHPINKPEVLRVAHLKDIAVATYIYQGERDKLGDKQEVGEYSLSENVSLCWLEDGDHDLKPRKRSGYSQDQHLHKVVNNIIATLAK